MWKGQQAARDYGMDSEAFSSLACRSVQGPRLPGETQPGWSKHRLGWLRHRPDVKFHEPRHIVHAELMLVLRRARANLPWRAVVLYLGTGVGGMHGSLWWRWWSVPLTTRRQRPKHFSEWALREVSALDGVLAGTAALVHLIQTHLFHFIYLSPSIPSHLPHLPHLSHLIPAY